MPAALRVACRLLRLLFLRAFFLSARPSEQRAAQSSGTGVHSAACIPRDRTGHARCNRAPIGMRSVVSIVLIVGAPGIAHADEAPWKNEERRPFVAATVDAGLPYAQPTLFVGWGQPHWQWAGVEARVGTTATFAHAFVGLHAALPFLDASFGVRETQSFRWPLLVRRDSYEADAHEGEGNARYRAIDLEVSGVLPFPAGFLLWDALVVRTLAVSPDRDVYEESLRAIIRPPVGAIGRLAYAARVGRVSFGPLAEVVLLPQRAGPVVRAGAVVSVQCTPHLDALFALTLPVASPDALAIVDASSGMLGVRWRWASAERAASFP
jgi:hypothetical protein